MLGRHPCLRGGCWANNVRPTSTLEGWDMWISKQLRMAYASNDVLGHLVWVCAITADISCCAIEHIGHGRESRGYLEPFPSGSAFHHGILLYKKPGEIVAVDRIGYHSDLHGDGILHPIAKKRSQYLVRLLNAEGTDFWIISLLTSCKHLCRSNSFLALLNLV